MADLLRRHHSVRSARSNTRRSKSGYVPQSDSARAQKVWVNGYTKHVPEHTEHVEGYWRTRAR